MARARPHFSVTVGESEGLPRGEIGVGLVEEDVREQGPARDLLVEWQTLQISFNGGVIEVRLIGQRIFAVEAPHRYEEDRFGFDVPFQVTAV